MGIKICRNDSNATWFRVLSNSGKCSENDPKYHLQDVEYTQQEETTVCSDHKFPDGIILRLRNKSIDGQQPESVKTNRKKSRKSKKHGQSSSSRDVKA
jgi:hypothetical protein